MFQSIVRRVRSLRAPWRRSRVVPVTPVAEGAPEPGDESVTEAVTTSAPMPSTTTMSPGGEAAPDVSRTIRHELRIQLGELRSRFREPGADTDVRTLLDGIGRPGVVVRQPPAAAQAVLSLSRRRDYGLDEMTGLFERDPAMSQALLRHANSAWYAGLSTKPVLGIKTAIQRVGTKGVHATVMHHILQSELSRPGSGLDGMARQVWEHMVRTAPLARGIAPFFGADPETAFTLALLHDVGKLVFFDRVATERKRLRRDVALPDGFVTAALTVLHEPLGGLAALEWGLDDPSARIIATHHRWGDHPDGDPHSQVIYLAEAVDIAHQRDESPDLEFLWESGDLDGPLDDVRAWLASEGQALEEEERVLKRKQALTR